MPRRKPGQHLSMISTTFYDDKDNIFSHPTYYIYNGQHSEYHSIHISLMQLPSWYFFHFLFGRNGCIKLLFQFVHLGNELLHGSFYIGFSNLILFILLVRFCFTNRVEYCLYYQVDREKNSSIIQRIIDYLAIRFIFLQIIIYSRMK